MAYTNYKVVPLTAVNGIPIIPGAHHVSKIVEGYFVAYKKAGRVGSTLAIIYRDPSGRFLVGAERALLDALPGESLDSLVTQTPANWHTWKGAIEKDNPQDNQNLVVIKTDKVSKTMSKAAPINLDATRRLIGARPTASHRLAQFSPTEIEKQTKWIGDTLELKLSKLLKEEVL